MSEALKVPVSVFTGFLGAGKTTIISDLIRQMANECPDYSIAYLKNEFGDSEIDGDLIRNASSGVHVQEMINGCICCVLVGQLQSAVADILSKFQPKRIIIETSGTAFPAPIALQLKEISQVALDGIITVIDCENFTGYEDKSYAAKLQARYTDIILFNKVELVSERQFDIVMDHVNDLNTDTPKIKYHKGMDYKLLFGIDSKLSNTEISTSESSFHGVQVMQIKSNSLKTIAELRKFLDSLPKDSVYRCKGIVISDQAYLINYGFGRMQVIPYQLSSDHTGHSDESIHQKAISLCFMGYLDEVKEKIDKFFK
jgi:G3E family GTPase